MTHSKFRFLKKRFSTSYVPKQEGNDLYRPVAILSKIIWSHMVTGRASSGYAATKNSANGYSMALAGFSQLIQLICHHHVNATLCYECWPTCGSSLILGTLLLSIDPMIRYGACLRTIIYDIS